MARDINKRLGHLRSRRGGTDRLYALDAALQRDVLAKSILNENWQKRAATQPYTRYALGAMEQVDAEYTRIGVETAERVGRQLALGLNAISIPVEFRLQGSVPLNVHIRGVSDVDLLKLDADFLTYHTYGSKAGTYGPSSNRNSVDVLTRLRNEAESILRDKYPAATVDCSGAKAIKLSGGSLARPVDVVPSHWLDTVQYQSSGHVRDRAVTILDKKARQTLDNFPFLHIYNVDLKDTAAAGGLKKAIRLCKNVKSDAEDDGKTVELPSFDIAATMYHADMGVLQTNIYYELSVLAETQRFLDWLTSNEEEAKKLRVPDGSRIIFDSAAKLRGLRALSIEMDDLLREVAKEQNHLLHAFGDGLSLDTARNTVSSTVIPAAA